MNQETQDYLNRLGEAFIDRYQIQIPVTASALETIVQSLNLICFQVIMQVTWNVT